MITVYDQNTTIDDVRKVELKRPAKAGSVWKGIRHGQLVDTLVDEFRLREWQLEDAKFSLSNDKADLAAAFKLRLPSITVPEGQSLSLGLLTSNALRRSLRFVVGTEVAVCNNGMANGELLLNRKHTSGIDLLDEFDGMLARYETEASHITADVERLRNTELSDEQVDHLLMTAGRTSLGGAKRVMPWSRIGAVDKEYRNPTFGEHGTGTAWALLNAFTFVAKRNPPQDQMTQILRFRQLLPSVN